VLGDRGLGEAQGCLKFADAAGPVQQQPQDAQALAVGQGLQGFQQDPHLLPPKELWDCCLLSRFTWPCQLGPESFNKGRELLA
jgi:hypothetical protein